MSIILQYFIHYYTTSIESIEKCQAKTHYCSYAQEYCNDLVLGPYQATGLNVYNIREECGTSGLCYDFSATTAWLNNKSVQQALGVNLKWEECNFKVNG